MCENLLRAKQADWREREQAEYTLPDTEYWLDWKFWGIEIWSEVEERQAGQTQPIKWIKASTNADCQIGFRVLSKYFCAILMMIMMMMMMMMMMRVSLGPKGK